MKTALVTGANKGIGRQVAQELAAKGLHVFVGARKAEAGRAAAEEISQAGKATFLQLDVASAESVDAAARELARQIGQLDVLVNNAGMIVEGDAGVLTNPDALFRETFETNLLGPIRVTRAFQALLEKSDDARVINVSSGGGQLTDGADGWAPAYCVSKAALNMVTSQLAVAFKNLAVNSVCPGWVRTDMGGANATRTVEQGADTIVWLATEAPRTITGSFLRDRKKIDW